MVSLSTEVEVAEREGKVAMVEDAMLDIAMVDVVVVSCRCQDICT
jgi:hypothetical protein